eukprot:CAMPEP_0115268212 /NCGR_PEP_ID=MMETSP0270-20121206/52401_1 /TAXON_ID=71861 /ORGANISM="Scrippsiella trochoidea, Strain CCMP3099" /LENGTH=64 /DNA_ID=CAMNT_0002684401 /DNA_START=96 /DNA_END=288 /DNA_ORIENTATION=-
MMGLDPEADVTYQQLLLLGVQRRRAYGHAIFLQHLHQRGLPCVVKAQEADIGVPGEEPEEVEEA